MQIVALRVIQQNRAKLYAHETQNGHSYRNLIQQRKGKMPFTINFFSFKNTAQAAADRNLASLNNNNNTKKSNKKITYISLQQRKPVVMQVFVSNTCI